MIFLNCNAAILVIFQYQVRVSISKYYNQTTHIILCLNRWFQIYLVSASPHFLNFQFLPGTTQIAKLHKRHRHCAHFLFLLCPLQLKHLLKSYVCSIFSSFILFFSLYQQKQIFYEYFEFGQQSTCQLNKNIYIHLSRMFFTQK